MTEKNTPSENQLTVALDNVPVAIFVNAVDDKQLLYTNRLARELFPKSQEKGITCYEVAGFSQPCPFCQMGELEESEFTTREYHHPGTNRTYQVSGKIIDWMGQQAHIEYILDITEKKQEEKRRSQVEKEMTDIFDNLSCGLCIYQYIDRQIVPVFHNKAFYKITGYSQTNIQSVERTMKYLNVHPEDKAGLQDKVANLIQNGGILNAVFRLWNDKKLEYCWMHLEGTLFAREDGQTLLYGVYREVGEQKRLEKELIQANEKMQDVINAIPGGVAVYKVTDVFQVTYFSDGVAELMGYTVEEYRRYAQKDAADLIYPEDRQMVVSNLWESIRTNTVVDFEFRKQHKKGYIVWVHIQARKIGDENGIPLLQCVFHNITTLKETQRELDHLVNSIPGGIASYKVEGGRFLSTYYSDGVTTLSGHTREEYDKMIEHDALDVIYPSDRQRVMEAAMNALETGSILDISYRIYHKNGNLIWIHLNGRRMGPLLEASRFYAIFTYMPDDAGIDAYESADTIYITDKENYELLYTNESKELSFHGAACVGLPCYQSLYGFDKPCYFCTLHTYGADEKEHEVAIGEGDLIYATCIKETMWNGIPAYIHYIRDVTEEVKTRREKERLEMYFQTLIKNLPGGISVIRCEQDGSITPEYISEGFAAMTHMTLEEARKIYFEDVFTGIHPEDIADSRLKLQEFMKNGEEHCEFVARFWRGESGYFWVRNHMSKFKGTDGICRLYCIYTDVSQAMEEKEQLRQKYEEQIMQHYRTISPDTLILGHCNITQDKILEIWDSTNSHLLESFGVGRDDFFKGLSTLVVEDWERQAFLERYLNAPSLAAFAKGETEKTLKCFVKLPKDVLGRYVHIKVNMVETPDTGDITGILSVMDITNQVVSEQILHRLSVTSHDYVIDLDLNKDYFTILTCNKNACRPPESEGCHSARVSYMASEVVVPRDREVYVKALDGAEIERRLKETGLYTFTYSIEDEAGNIRAKNMTVSAIDLRLKRVSIVCTDITASVREQQNLLSMLAYTFEMAGMIHINDKRFVMHTRQTVLENLPPFVCENYNTLQEGVAAFYMLENCQENVSEQFRLETMLQNLKESPAGYEFVFPYQGEQGMCYKQINVLWGDRDKGTICIVRADVTKVLAAERQAQNTLEEALNLAKEANRAKSDFLSAMSHDIRTPLNGIMGMTALAAAHIDDQDWMRDCIQKISISARHLHSLVNDVLDMSRIERSQVTLSHMRISLYEFVDQLAAMIDSQARAAGLQFNIQLKGVTHTAFFGDSLRINQILINLLSNAVKFTQEGGVIDFIVEEIAPVKDSAAVRYRFTVQDTGIGMNEAFMNRIFEPFARDYGTMRIEGTGLGLSIAHGLVELMNGKIMVESKLRVGSIFRVELEFESAPEEEISERKSQGNWNHLNSEKLFAGRRFLVAEDNALNADILCEILGMYAAKAIVKSDGQQAVEAFQASPPNTYDAILMDIQMPNMNGYEAAQAIRGMNRADANTIPIIALTANAFAEDIQMALDAGMTAHVAKPIDVAVLCTTLERVLMAKPT